MNQEHQEEVLYNHQTGPLQSIVKYVCVCVCVNPKPITLYLLIIILPYYKSTLI